MKKDEQKDDKRNTNNKKKHKSSMIKGVFRNASSRMRKSRDKKMKKKRRSKDLKTFIRERKRKKVEFFFWKNLFNNLKFDVM